MKLTISQEGSNPITIDINQYMRSTESTNVAKPTSESDSTPAYLVKLVKPLEKFSEEYDRNDDIFYYVDSVDDDIFDKTNYSRFKKMCIDFLKEEFVYIKSYYSKEEYDKIMKSLNSPRKGEAIAKRWIEGMDGTFLLLIDDTIQGFITFEDKEKEYHVSKLYVSPKFRGKGYATKLLKIGEERAKKERKDLTVNVVKTNEPAYKLYKKFGFKKI